MCLESLRLSQEFRSSMLNVTVGVASVNILSESPHRVAIIFTATDAGEITVSTINPVISGQGFLRNTLSESLVLTSEEYGDLTQQAWFAIADGVNLLFSVIEVIDPTRGVKTNGIERGAFESTERRTSGHLRPQPATAG